MRHLPMLPLLALALTAAPPMARSLQAQDPRLVHPRDMHLPEPAFQRPDPAAYRHTAGEAVAYIAEDRRVPLVTVTAFVRVGHGDADDAAVPRAVEHALRAGPATIPATAFASELAGMVADWRVVMGPELTEVTLDVPAEDAGRAIELLVATLRGPRFGDVPAARAPSELPAAGASGESGPVLYEGSLPLAVDLLDEWLLGESPYGGLRRRAVAADEARRFHAAHFGPATTVFAIAGDIGGDEARDALDAALRGWSGGRAPQRRARPVPAMPDRRELRLYDTDGLQGWVVLGQPLPTVPPADRAALDVMNYILGGGHFDTRLFRELRDKRGLANTGGGFPVSFDYGPGSYTFRTYGRPDVVPRLVELTLREVERMRTEPVTQDELDIARGALADGVFAMRYADGFTTARSLAEEWARDGSHDASASYQARVRAVTRADVRAAARGYLSPDRFRVVVLAPVGAIDRAALDSLFD